MLTSIVVSLAVLIGLFEFAGSYRYDQWKAQFPDKYDWFGQLTMPSDNAELMWEYWPNASIEFAGATIDTNSHGFRDRERELAKAPGDLRIVFVGDSVTVGWGMDAAATFVPLFEAAANRNSPAQVVEALPIAVGGYNAMQVLELFSARALAFSPDIVVYVVCMNDFDFERSSAEKTKFFRKPSSFFLRTVEKVWLKYSGVNYYDYYYRKNGAAVLAGIGGAKADADARGVDFRVAIMPVFDDDSTEYSLAEVHNELLDRLAADGVPVIDLLRPFAAQADKLSGYATDGIHLTETGHRIVADELVGVLLN